ncbi:uncharacterized protein LOC134260540, partial [Saccostrea cucullata]|uniref:uncharacterized protein LOC134260540 n=1 Tax=Saccostrea cuccullata TaxID=36930 RepID=UPI002ED1EF85
KVEIILNFEILDLFVEKLWREVHGLLTEDERNKIEWTKDKLPVTGSWNIYNLISPLHFKRKAKVEGRAEDLIEKYEIKFEYLNEGAVGRIVKFKPDIAFVSPENDVLVLELAELESEPRFFNLVEYNISEEKIHVFGHPDGIPLQHDPGCTVINNETKLAELKKEGIAFFKKELPDKECEIKDDYALCEISEDKILFHSSSSTAKGASGAPLTIVVNDTIKVYGMLLNGHPKVFYNYFNKKDMKRHELLVESGISMRKIRSLLESCLPEFEQELF